MPEQRKHRVYKIEKERVWTMHEDELAEAVEAQPLDVSFSAYNESVYALHEADDGAVLKRFANGLRADADKESFLWSAEAMLTHADYLLDDRDKQCSALSMGVSKLISLPVVRPTVRPLYTDASAPPGHASSTHCMVSL